MATRDTTELQATLEKTVNFAGRIKQDYETIKAAYESLKAQHSELQVAFEEAKEESAQAVQTKNAVKRECEDVYKQWNDHMKIKAKEFADLQATMVPSRELDLLRIQMAEELELPHRQRIEQLTEEISNYRDKYLAEHRELEMLRMRHGNMQEQFGKKTEMLNHMHAVEKEELANRNRHLQELMDDDSLSEKLRGVERENGTLHVRKNHLESECANLREERNRLKAELRAAVSLSEKKLGAARNGEASMKHAHAAEMEKNGKLDSLLKSEQAKTAQYHDVIVNTQERVRQLTASLATKERELKFERARAEQQLADEGLVSRQREARAHASEQEAKRSLAEFKKTSVSEMDALDALNRELIAKSKESKDNATRKLRESENARTSLQNQLSALQKSFSEEEAEWQAERTRLLRSAEESEGRLESGMLQVESLGTQLKSARESNDGERADAMTRNKENSELQTEVEVLQEKYRSVVEKNHALTLTIKERDTQVDLVRREGVAAAAVAEQDRNVLVSKVTQASSAAESEKTRLAQQLQSVLATRNEEIARARESIQKLRLDKQRYKRMAVALRDSCKAEESSRQQLMVQLQAKALENKALNKQISDISMQTTLLRARISSLGDQDVALGKMGGDFFYKHSTVST